ncbi:MAG: DUF4292 domain-containing protein [Muribaculum sp.]|nr:DUF4292 domain-containing protein [Muribaculum sp.]
MNLKWLVSAIMSVSIMVANAATVFDTDTIAVDVLTEDVVVVDSVALQPETIMQDIVDEAVDAITHSYPDDWSQLSMQGKLSFEGLPINPSVKLYMKRGEVVIMSARAPIVGEVARLEICNDSITIINKHTRKYWSQQIQHQEKVGPDIISDIQDVMLGYVAYPGHGRMNSELAHISSWTVVPDNKIFIYPDTSMQFRSSEYGFIIDSDDYALSSFLLLLSGHDAVLETTYLYGEAGWTLGLTIETNKGSLGGQLQLSYPDYNPSPLDLTNAGEKFSRTDIKGILKF